VKYALREAIAAFRRAPITVLAAAMVGLALFVIGLFSLAAYNMEEALREVETRVEVVVYLRDDVRTSEIELAQRDLATPREVLDVRYVSKAMALENARRDLRDLEGVFADLAVNPLPASLEVRLREEHRNKESVENVAALASAYPFVEDVAYGREWVEKIFALRRIAGVSVAVMGVSFAIVAALIMGTALKIAVFARRDEIYVMRLVGARDGFIRLPFLLEGAITGLAGGVFAVLLTYVTFRVAYRFLFEISWVPATWVLVGVTAGVVFGVFASGFSVRRHLREV
jgi:cell division transport system permease protein